MCKAGGEDMDPRTFDDDDFRVELFFEVFALGGFLPGIVVVCLV